jgi:hypothetical protein
MALCTGFSRLGETGGLACGSGEVAVAQAASAAATENVFFAVLGQVGNKLSAQDVGDMGRRWRCWEIFRCSTCVLEFLPAAGGQLRGLLGRFWRGTRVSVGAWVRDAPDERSTGDFDEEVGAGAAIHSFAQAGMAFFGEQSRLEMLSDEVIEVVIGLKNDIATASAIAATGSAFGAVGFSEKGDTTLAAVAGARKHFDLVDEHRK